MSENITHTALVDDVSRLAIAWPALPAAFRGALTSHRAAAQLGGITRRGDRHNPELLAELRAAHEQDGLDPRGEQKLAFVLGWLTHRAVDRQMKPIWRRDIPGERATGSPTDCSIYHDVFLLREVFHDGDPPYAPGLLHPGPAALPGARGLDVAAVEELFGALWQRMLIRMHTFISDDDHVSQWLDQVIDRHQALTVDLQRYALAYASPDPEKVRRYLIDVRFYDAGDPLIALTRAAAADGPAIAAALAAEQASQYGQAMRKAMHYLAAAGEFFDRAIDDDELRRRLDIGRPEVG